jgi:hypothetical protein
MIRAVQGAHRCFKVEQRRSRRQQHLNPMLTRKLLLYKALFGIAVDMVVLAVFL